MRSVMRAVPCESSEVANPPVATLDDVSQFATHNSHARVGLLTPSLALCVAIMADDSALVLYHPQQ